MTKTVRISDDHHQMLKDIQESASQLGTPQLQEVTETSIEKLYAEVVDDGS